MHSLCMFIFISLVCISFATKEHSCTLHRIKRGSSSGEDLQATVAVANNSKILEDFAPVRNGGVAGESKNLMNLTSAKLTKMSTKQNEARASNQTELRTRKSISNDVGFTEQRSNLKVSLTRIARKNPECKYAVNDSNGDIESPHTVDEDALFFGSNGIENGIPIPPYINEINQREPRRNNHQAKIYSITAKKNNKNMNNDNREDGGNIKYTIKIISQGKSNEKDLDNDANKHSDTHTDDDNSNDDSQNEIDRSLLKNAISYGNSMRFDNFKDRFIDLRSRGDVRAEKREEYGEHGQQHGPQNVQPNKQGQLHEELTNQQGQQEQQGSQGELRKQELPAHPLGDQFDQLQLPQLEAQQGQHGQQQRSHEVSNEVESPHITVKLKPLEGILKFANMLLYKVGGLDSVAQHSNPAAVVFNNPVDDDNDAIDYFYNAIDALPVIRGAPSPNVLSSPNQINSFVRTPFTFQPSLTAKDSVKPFNFIENAIDMVLTNEEEKDDDFEIRCPIHYEKKSAAAGGVGNGNDIGTAGGSKNDVIEVCSCRLYKKKKNVNV